MTVPAFPDGGREGRETPVRCDGRALGDHGNRADSLKKQLVMKRLQERMSHDGKVPRDVRTWALDVAGIRPRQLQRWISQVRAGHVDHILAHGDVSDQHEIFRLQRIRAGQRPSAWDCAFNEQLIREIDSYDNPQRAWEVMHARKDHPLFGIGRSTFYAQYAKVRTSVQRGTRESLASMREHEMSARLTTDGEPIWFIDEFDTKTNAYYGGQIVSPRLLWIRDRETGFPESFIVLPHAARSEDTLSVVGLAALGGQFELDGEVVEYSGTPPYLGSDQGGALFSAEVRERLGFVGMRPFVGASRTPQHQGSIEVPHDVFAQALARRQGTRRTPANHSGNPYSTGVADFADVFAACEDVIDWLRSQLRTDTARHAGRTAAEYKRDLLKTGELQLQSVKDAHLAELAEIVDEREHNPKKGVRWNKDDYTSVELAQWGEHETVRVAKFSGNDDILFVRDSSGQFLSIVKRYELFSHDELFAILEAREARRDWVDQANKERAKNQKNGQSPPVRDGGGMSADFRSSVRPDAPLPPEQLVELPQFQRLAEHRDAIELLARLSAEQLQTLTDLLSSQRADDSPAGPAEQESAGESTTSPTAATAGDAADAGSVEALAEAQDQPRRQRPNRARTPRAGAPEPTGITPDALAAGRERRKRRNANNNQGETP